MIEVESRFSDEALLWVGFTREQAEGETDRAAAMELIAATCEFLSGWISPLAAAVRVESCDPSNHYLEEDAHPPARPAWFLHRRQLDEHLQIREAWIGSQERDVEEIDAAELRAFVEEALVQPPPYPRHEVALAELLIEATEVALPEGVEIKLMQGGTRHSPISRREGRRWLLQGPDRTFLPSPVTLRAYNHHGVTKLVVEIFWDFWLKHSAGNAELRAAIARVLARDRGWQFEKAPGIG